MDVTVASTAGSGTLTDVNGDWILDTKNTSEGLRYQQTFNISLETGGVAEEIVIDSATSFRLLSRHLTFNAMENSAPEKASTNTSFDSTGVLVTLPFPRLIGSISFASSLSPSGKTTQLFRTDGDVVSEDPVASYRNSSSQLRSFQQNDGVGVSDEEFKLVADSAGGSQVERNIIQGSISDVSGLPKGNFGSLIDSRILVQLKGTNNLVLSNNSIEEFNLTTGPENLRVGVRIGESDSETFYLPLTFERGKYTQLGAAFVEQLRNLLDRFRNTLPVEPNVPPPTLPNDVNVSIVIESDAPCRLTIDDFVLRYRVARQSFPNGKNKEVLRFSGKQLDEQQVSISIPTLATLHSSILKIAADGVLAEGDSAKTEAVSPGELLLQVQENGLRVDQSHSWSTQVVVAEPKLSNGWSLLLAGLLQDTLLTLQLFANNDGSPSGDLLASTTAELKSAKRTTLLHFLFEKPLILQPNTYWLTLRCRNGAAVWYTHTDSIGLSIQQRGDNIGVVQNSLNGIANCIGDESENGRVLPPPNVIVAGQPLEHERNGSDWCFDLTSVLGPVTEGGNGLRETTIDILSSHTTPFTVYAPRIEYDH